MRLDKWLVKQAMTQAEFARLIGVNRSNVKRWCDGDRLPSLSTIEMIAKETRGEVMANDFMQIKRKARPRKASGNPRRPLVAA